MKEEALDRSLWRIRFEEDTDLAYDRLWNDDDDDEIMCIPHQCKIMYLHTLTQTC